MPFVTTPDNIKLYYEETGKGTPILFVHEFASDHTGWEPQMREFGKRHRCIAYSARGYTPSDVPAGVENYSYQHVMRDCVAVLDQLGIDKAHLIGLSMGSYTSLQVALNHPSRVRSMVLAGIGSGSERWYTKDFRAASSALGDLFEGQGAGAVADSYGKSPARVTFDVKDPRGYAEFVARLAAHDAKGSAYTSRGFQGARPSIYDFENDIRTLSTPALIVVGDEDDRCVEPSLFLKDTLPASGLVVMPKTGHSVNLEEPDLFNAVVGDFLARVEAGRWTARDPTSRKAADAALQSFMRHAARPETQADWVAQSPVAPAR